MVVVEVGADGHVAGTGHLAVVCQDLHIGWGEVMVMPGGPAAFMSYVRFNDEHDGGLLTQFRERLAAEVKAQTGQDFAIFQDRNDIAWGQNWQQRIDEALDAVTLLLVIVTPSLFHSPACRDEFARFLDRERDLGRGDLILPVYYIGAREMDDLDLREADEMARVLASRQFADWRELRFEPFASPLVGRAIAQLAARMGDTFRQSSAPPSQRPAGRIHEAGASAGPLGQTGSTGLVTAKTEPPTHVVDVFPGRGDFTTVSTAIKEAKPGDRIVVRPGLYAEALTVDKPLEIIGDGSVADIEIRAQGASALVFRASFGRVVNLTLRQAGGEGKWFGVDISQGRLDLEGCDISSQSLACVGIRSGADPRLRRNKIHDGKEAGVKVLYNGLGTLEDNDITGNTLSGLEIGAGGNPTVRRSQVHGNKQSGVVVHNNGLGTLEDNDITGNARSGVSVQTGGNPTVRHNRIYGNTLSGVHVYNSGLGMLEDNDIAGNARSGVSVQTGGNPTLRGNRINRNGYQAVRIYDGGRGVIEDNDLTGNTQGAWSIAEDCQGNVTRARNKE